MIAARSAAVYLHMCLCWMMRAATPCCFMHKCPLPAQVFAPEQARSAPAAERPRGAFGQRFPQNVPAAAGSPAVTGAMRIQPQVLRACEHSLLVASACSKCS